MIKKVFKSSDNRFSVKNIYKTLPDSKQQNTDCQRGKSKNCILVTCLCETENDGGHKAYKRAAHFENIAHNKEQIRQRGAGSVFETIERESE